jgi:hypothetical protein
MIGIGGRPGALRRALGALVAVTLLTVVVPPAMGIDAAQASTATPRLIFGMGDEISTAQSSKIVKAAPINMVTSWYNNSGDLDWMQGYAATDQVEQVYAQGKANELVVDLSSDPSYALSAQFQTNLATLISIFKGNGPAYGPLYVVLFTEFDTYEPADNASYIPQLMTAYEAAVTVVHKAYSQAKVALGLGGYNWSSSPTGTTDLSMETAAIKDSDFVAVQAMQDCTNEGQLENEVHASIAQLSSFGKPIMISYMKLWGGSVPCQTSAMSTFEKDILNTSTLSTLTSEGLFALGFRVGPDIDHPGPAHKQAVADIDLYSSGSDITLPPWPTG